VNKTYTIDGVKAIKRAFAELPDKVAKKVVRQEMRKSLKPVAARVKSLAPKRSGSLARAIKLRAKKRRKRGQIALTVVVDYPSTPAKLNKKTGQPIYYPFAVEYGAPKRGRLPNPFVKRAFDETKDQARDDCVRGITAGIDREVAKGNGR